MDFRAYLIRLNQNDKQTLGNIIFYDCDVKKILEVKCLELPDRGNKKSISRVLAATYKCVLRYSKTYGWHYHLLDVKGRTLILIHFGNYYYNTEGCILVGNDFTDINKDGYRDVTSSKKTLKRMLEKIPSSFMLKIIDELN